MSKFMLVVFTNPVAGREDEYNRWYTDQHIHDVTSVPGFSSAERFKTQVRMVGDLKQDYLAIYEMDVDTVAEAEAAMVTLRATDMVKSDALSVPDTMVGIFEASSPTVSAPNAKEQGTFRFIAMTNAVEGREADYNEWYNTVHLQDVTRVPGFTSGRRYKLQKTMTGAFVNDHLSLFGLDATTPEAQGAILKAMGAANMAKTDSGRSATAIAATFESCSEKVYSRNSKVPA